MKEMEIIERNLHDLFTLVTMRMAKKKKKKKKMSSKGIS